MEQPSKHFNHRTVSEDEEGNNALETQVKYIERDRFFRLSSQVYNWSVLRSEKSF